MYQQYLRDLQVEKKQEINRKDSSPENVQLEDTSSSNMEAQLLEQQSREQDDGSVNLSGGHQSLEPNMSLVQEVIRGNVTVGCPSTAKIVRIFTSSTFTDTRHERNALMERVYPALKEVCQQHGYEFQVVDMRWGIRDEATDDHMTTDLCLKEIDLCKRLSTGPNFVTFLSHKYGYRDFPNKIEATEFEKLYGCTEGEAKTLLDRWFKKDENAVPVTYVLQPISTILPELRGEDEDKRKEAKAVWYKQSTIMQEAIVKAAKQILDPRRAHRYLMSVTEAEITRGIIESRDHTNNCLWFHRVIEDIEKQQPTYLLSRYKDCHEDGTKAKESQDLLQDLCNKRLTKLIAPHHHKTYNVKWTEKGIDPESSREHQQYINKLCKEFQELITDMVTSAIEQRKKSHQANPLYDEIVEHTVFCQNKSDAFHGRHATLDLISNYLSGTSTTPFIVYGPSGCGKTSVVAMTATLARKTFNERAGVVIRFIGTSPDSSAVGTLLSSVISQIWSIYRKEPSDLPTNIKELTKVFHTTLGLASKDEPLVLLLDSLDQLDPSGGARQLSWLPRELPENVKMVLSTLPEPQYQCFPALKEIFQRENFLEVPTLNDEDVDGIISKWLEVRKRCLTFRQRQVIVDSFQNCALPLFLKLSFDEACRWTSFSSESQTTLQESVRGSINALFSRIETIHGKIFVSKCLAYLTLSKSGLTESELEDILSCDDDVLNDVYMYWTPPVRRLPPLLLVRLKADLGQYLVDRGADGVRVFFWYHRQFIEAATDKYCTDPDSNLKMHSALADFFAGTWANGNAKPYLDKKGNASLADRKVASQPIKFNTGYNLRKLNNLPHQRTEAKQLALLKEECLLNFTFLQGKINASGSRSVLEDFKRARDNYLEDDQLKTVRECLQLSQDALINCPNELPSQLLCRIKNKEDMKELLDDCIKTQNYFFMPNKDILTNPGGPLVHCLADHSDKLEGLDVTEDLHYAVTSSKDRTVKIWDIEKGTLVKSIENVGENPKKLLLACGDSVIVVHTEEFMNAFKLETGAGLYELNLGKRMPFCVGGEGNNILCIFAGYSALLLAADTGEITHQVECDLLEPRRYLSHQGPCSGSLRYAAAVDDKQYTMYIFDFETKQFTHKTEIFHGFEDSNCDYAQYTIDAAVLSPSGEYLYISDMDTNNLQVYRTETMKKERTFSGDRKDSISDFRITKDGKTVYFAKYEKVVTWDLESGLRSNTLKQPSANGFSDVIMTGTTVVSINEDQVVRIWDLTKEGTEKNEKEINPFQISAMETLSNPRYVLLRLSRSPRSPGRHFQIHDMELDIVVRHFELDVEPSQLLPLSDCKQAVMLLARKLKKVNLMSGEVTTFQGKTSCSEDAVLVRDETEVATPSRGRRHLKIYNITTGHVLSVMKTGNKRLYERIWTNDKGSILVAGTNKGPCYIFDIVSRSCLTTVMNKSFSLDDLYMDRAVITNDGKYVILQGLKFPKHVHQRYEGKSVIFCWDIQNDCLHNELVDDEYNLKHAEENVFVEDNGVEVLKLLDDRTVITHHKDTHIRVFDITSGKLTRRISGHLNCELSIVSNGPYFLSHGLYIDDNNFRLMNRTTFETIATFSPDIDMKQISLTSDGYHVVGFSREYDHPVLWRIMGGPSDQSKETFKPLSAFPNIFGHETVKCKLTLEGDYDDNDDDPDDPDTDVDEQ